MLYLYQLSKQTDGEMTMTTRMNLTTKEQEQDNLLKDMKREIANGGSPYRTARTLQGLGDMTEWRFNKFATLIEEAQEKGLLS